MLAHDLLTGETRKTEAILLGEKIVLKFIRWQASVFCFFFFFLFEGLGKQSFNVNREKDSMRKGFVLLPLTLRPFCINELRVVEVFS